MLRLDVFSPSEVGDYLSSDGCVSHSERPSPTRSAKLVPTARLPPNVDQLVPLSMSILISFVEKLAPKWDEIGIHLGLEDTVKVLRETQSSLTVKMAMIFEKWLENDDVSWYTLVNVLKKIGYHKVASHFCEYLHDQGEYEYMFHGEYYPLCTITRFVRLYIVLPFIVILLKFLNFHLTLMKLFQLR